MNPAVLKLLTHFAVLLIGILLRHFFPGIMPLTAPAPEPAPAPLVVPDQAAPKLGCHCIAGGFFSGDCPCAGGECKCKPGSKCCYGCPCGKPAPPKKGDKTGAVGELELVPEPAAKACKCAGKCKCDKCCASCCPSGCKADCACKK